MPVFDFLLVVKDVALFRVLQVEELHPLAQVRKAQLVRLQPHGTLRVELLKTLNLGSSLGHFPVRLGRSQLTLGYCLLELRDVALSGPSAACWYSLSFAHSARSRSRSACTRSATSLAGSTSLSSALA